MNVLIQPQPVKETTGLPAISKGVSLDLTHDPEMPEAGTAIYDALYAWCADMPVSKVVCLLRRM